MKNNVMQAYKIFNRDVEIAIRVFFLCKGVYGIASKDKKALSTLEKNTLSWNIILHSLQCTFFVSLGRLFEGDETISADKFLRTCIDNADEFSKNSLRNRKIIQYGGKQEWLDLYMNNIYEPKIKDFDKLIDKLAKRKTLYIKTYRPIRHKIITHLNVATIDNFSSLFGKTEIDEIQDFLLVMYQIDRVIFHLLFNGKLYPIDSFILEEESPVFKDIESLLKNI
jgi:hypothetical protein